MANMRNTLHPRFVTACGVICENVKLNSHCVAAPMATPPSRIRVGKISPMYSFARAPVSAITILPSS